MLNQVFGPGKDSNNSWNKERLMNLDPLEFEALVACVYEKSTASSCHLTKKTGDRGADIIAYDYPSAGENTLIDAKHSRTHKPLSSSDGIRQVSHARKQYQASLGETFGTIQVVTNRPSADRRIVIEAENSEVDIVLLDSILALLQNHPVKMTEIQTKLASSRVSI